MAETPKKTAPTRKPAAKRGPTKAASLKALGLTQKDLDEIRVTKTHRAKVQDHSERLDLIEEVAAIEEKEETSKETPVWFARNLRYVEFRMRLGRQTDRIAPKPLKPRGQRGDMIRLEQGDLQDEHLLANIELGCIEIITAAEAAKAINGQITNAQTSVHPALAMLRNPKGEEYPEGAVQGAEQFVDNSVVVAELNPVGGEYGEIQFDRGNIQRQTQAPGQAAELGRSLGGNPALLSDGFAAERAADAHARRKDIEGPAAGLPAGTRVVIDTPKRVIVPQPKGA